MTFEHLKRVRKRARQPPSRGTSKAERAVSAKALRQDHVWHAWKPNHTKSKARVSEEQISWRPSVVIRTLDSVKMEATEDSDMVYTVSKGSSRQPKCRVDYRAIINTVCLHLGGSRDKQGER